MSPPGPNPIGILGRYLGLDDAAERAAYLDEACRDDPDLRGRVDALVRACSELEPERPRTPTPDPTPETGSGSTGPAPASEVVESAGMVVGPFKLLRKIGEGGMGTVFMAEQERPIRRRVALKVIRPGMDSGQVIARFEAERQALALMDHPNIARVLEAGTTATGRPFFVMELVRGVAITEYCDKHQLTPRERLELFLPVCEAIQHAHQKGFIHRDIKPSNVMITLHDGRPQPKVIDFGVAKAVERQLTERTIVTEFGAIVGTLEYMSPEQVEMGALDVDTRSDIYSLGVLLYELLTGTTPLEREKLRTQSFTEVLRRVRDEDPARPSARLAESAVALATISARRRTEPARLAGLVRGELDWIVMKALEKDRTRRYGSAADLARDVRRHLDGDAVEAGPPSTVYRVRKFAGRHRGAIATAALFVALLVAWSALSLALAVRAGRARERAVAAEGRSDRQRARAEDRERTAIDAVKKFADVVRANAALKDDPRLAALRRALLREPEVFFRNLRDQLQADADTTDESLDRLGQACMDLGVLTVEVGDPAEALRAFEQALAIRRTLVRHDPGNARFARLLAVTQWDVGLRYLDNARPEDALALFEESRAILERLAREHPGDDDLRFFLGRTLHSVGLVHETSGRPARARAAFERALPIWQGLIRDEATRIRFGGDLSWSLSKLATLTGDPARLAVAVASYEDARPVRRRLAAEHPDEPWYQLDYAFNESRLAELLVLQGHDRDALATNEGLLPMWRRLVDRDQSNTRYRVELGNHLHKIGDLRERTGRPGAGEAFAEAREVRDRLVDEHPDSADFARSFAETSRRLAAIDERAGRAPSARALLDAAAARLRRALRASPNHPELQAALEETQRALGRLDAPPSPGP